MGPLTPPPTFTVSPPGTGAWVLTHPRIPANRTWFPGDTVNYGIGQGLIRVAVGLEHLDDIKADLALGLDTLS